jgi:hypothetical protein
LVISSSSVYRPLLMGSRDSSEKSYCFHCACSISM